MKATTQAKLWQAKLQAVNKPGGWARHIIDFDPEDPSTHGPWTLPQSALLARSRLAPIPWPRALMPTPKEIKPEPKANSPLPEVDVVVVTWTVAEGMALSDVLTPGYSSKGDWYDYAHNFASYASKIRKGAPASESRRLGSYFLTMIGEKKVLCFKSELHMSQDGLQLPVLTLWKQIIAETKCALIITTGTAGGIGAQVVLGDVVVAKQVRFDCQKSFKNQKFAHQVFTPSKATSPYFATASSALFAANDDKLPKSSRAPKILTSAVAPGTPLDVVTTDFFAFDTAENTYQLQGLGTTVEMGDAVLGLAIESLGTTAPQWLAIRNASDPQIPNVGTLSDQARQAAQIYEKFGYWTTICSAISTWAAISGRTS